MLKFFRKIRKKLANENKPLKYLRYAIGEILLVVIGILIALQVNNWNEVHKLKKVEIKILNELKADVAFSIIELDTVVSYSKKSLNELILIKEYIDKDLPYSAVLDTAFGGIDLWSTPYLPFVAYEALKTKGIDLISNDQLKREITKIYEFDIKLYIDENNRWEWAFSANTTQKMMLNHIRRKDAPEFYLAAPNDFDSLKDDVIFRNFLSVIIPIRNDHTDALVIVRKSFVNLLKGINEELEMLKK